MKKLLSFILSICLALTFTCSTVFAESDRYFEGQEHAVALSDSTDDQFDTHLAGGTCTACGNFSLTVVCNAEFFVYDQGYHTYMFGTKQCYATYYRCSSQRMCIICYHIDERYGNHDCYEKHQTCSYGNYKICPCDMKPSESQYP